MWRIKALLKLFEIKKDDYNYSVKLLGIKFKVRSLALVVKTLKLLKAELKHSTIPPAIYLANLTKEQKLRYLSNKFYEEVGYYPNLKNPCSFNEKINWMKLNYYNPLEQHCIDKYEFKGYIKEVLGDGFTIPLIGVYDDVNDINFDSLPDKFVIKTTASGSAQGVKVVKDKKKLDIDKLKYEFNNLLQEWNTIYYYCLSRGYKDIKPRIIIEEYVEQKNSQLFDYKFMCFAGKPRWVLVCSNRGKKISYENYDMDWNLIIPSPKSAKKSSMTKPNNFDEMIRIAEKLSAPFPFVRVDFYEVKNKIFVGELTFTPKGGFNNYYREWDKKAGEWLDLKALETEFVCK